MCIAFQFDKIMDILVLQCFLGNFDRNLQLHGHFSAHPNKNKNHFPHSQTTIEPASELMVFLRIYAHCKVCKNVPGYKEAIRELLGAV